MKPESPPNRIPSSSRESGESIGSEECGGKDELRGKGGCDTSVTVTQLRPIDSSPNQSDDEQDCESDCMIIEEAEDVEVYQKDNSNDDHELKQVTSTTCKQECEELCRAEEEQNSEGKSHNLPIQELKRKLAYCSVCQTQYPSHKQANLCLSKHGKRQCWLCLDVMLNTKDTYFQHCVKYHAIGQSNDIVGCPYCQKFFDFRQGFNQHIVKVHFSEDTSFVSTTACLSPKSLVDIYTGQPRTKEGDEVTTTNYDGGGSHLSDYETKSSGSEDCAPHSLSIDEGFHAEEGLPAKLKEGPFDTLTLHVGNVTARESVIRPTPHSYLPPIAYHDDHTQLRNQISKGIPLYHSSQSHLQLQQVSQDDSFRIGCGNVKGAEKAFPFPRQSNDRSYLEGRNAPTPLPLPSPPHQLSPGRESLSYPLPVSPCLLEMEKIVQDTPAQMRYFNSVNNMLRTVAEVGNGNNEHHHIPSHFAPSRFSQGPPSLQHYPHSRVAHHSEINGGNKSSDERFKVPFSGGVKRRILTKWDEHQEAKKTFTTLVPSPTILSSPSMEYLNVDQAQVAIHTGLNPHRVQDKFFWEQVLKESSSMYRAMNEQLSMYEGAISPVIQYDAPGGPYILPNALQHLSQQGYLDVVAQSRRYASNNHVSSHCPRVAARIEPNNSRRPVSSYIPNNQPNQVLASPHEYGQSRLLTAEESDQREIFAHHSQYQHRIVRQVISEDQKSDMNSTYRKRKSSVPVRVVPEGESVVVQNPFEEEETTSTKRSEIGTSQAQYSQHLKVGQFSNYQPKFTSGGQMTDFTSRSLGVSSKGGVANFSVTTANFGVLNNPMGKRVGIMGMGATRATMKIQEHPQFDPPAKQIQPVQSMPQGNMRTSGETHWPPFSVCQRYYETTHNIMTRIKDLDSQRKHHLERVQK